MPFRSVEQIQGYVERLAGATGAGLMPADTTRALNGLVGRAIELLNVGSLEDRIIALEAQQTGPRRAA